MFLASVSRFGELLPCQDPRTRCTHNVLENGSPSGLVHLQSNGQRQRGVQGAGREYLHRRAGVYALDTNRVLLS